MTSSKARLGDLAPVALITGAIATLAADKYSFGDYSFAVTGADWAPVFEWQAWMALGLTLVLLTVVVVRSARPRLAFILALCELALFLAMHAIQYQRDGVLRYVDWDYGHSSLRFKLFVGGLVLRATMIRLLLVPLRPKTQSMPSAVPPEA